MDRNKSKKSNIYAVYLLLVFVVFVFIIFMINYDGTNIIRTTLFDDNCLMDITNTFDITGCKR